MEAAGDERTNRINENAPSNTKAISAQGDDREPKMRRPPGRFRQLVKKHRRSIAEEAARTRPAPNDTPPYDQVILIPDDKVPEPIQGLRRATGHQYRDGEQCSRETVWGRIRGAYRKAYHGLGLRHWAFITVIAVYACIGGGIFSWIEHKHFEDQSRDTNNSLALDRGYLMEAILNITKNSGNPGRDLDELLKNYQIDKGLFPRTDIHWDFWDGVFYSYTLFTTIGYGHFVPTSHNGRIATMIYALFGIPLLLAVLNDFGKLLTRALKHVYSPIRHGIVHLWEMRKYKKMKARGEDICISHGETQQDMTQFDFPIPLAIIMVVVWLFACAGFFQLWETTWSYFDAFYFFFISLSTIGLGDLTPNHPKYMIASFPLILIGLTLVSLVINLIQNKIDELKQKAQDMLEDQLGLDTISASEYDDEAGGGGVQDAATQQPAAASSMKSRTNRTSMSNVALGVIQSIQLRAKRRRIGTQTEESYVRDVLRNEAGFEKETHLLLPASSTKLLKRNRESDTASQSSGIFS